MSTEEQKASETQALKRLLNAVEQLAKEASLTGMLKGGEERCIGQYNIILSKMEETGTVPEGLFDPLSEGASYGSIGVAASLLSAYLGDPKQELKIQLEQLPHTLHQHLKDGKLNQEIQVHVQKAFKQAGRELRDLGMLVRESMPDFVEQGSSESAKAKEVVHEAQQELHRQTQELREQMSELANQMQVSGISAERMQELAKKMQELTVKQVELMSGQAV